MSLLKEEPPYNLHKHLTEWAKRNESEWVEDALLAGTILLFGRGPIRSALLVGLWKLGGAVREYRVQRRLEELEQIMIETLSDDDDDLEVGPN